MTAVVDCAGVEIGIEFDHKGRIKEHGGILKT